MVAKVLPLSLIGQELSNTLEELKANLDSYISNRSMDDMLQACIDETEKLRSIFSLIMLKGAEALTIEMLEMLKQGATGEEIDFPVIAKSIGVLRRYLELMQNKDSDLPELLLPTINRIRSGRRKAPLSESCFFDITIEQLPNTLDKQKAEENIVPTTIRRVRHMYQVGLTNVIREDNVPGSARMMLRSVENIQRYSGNLPFAYLWWVVRAVLTALSQEALIITRPRKLLLGQLDRQFKAAELEWSSTVNQQPPEALLKELLYLVALISRDVGNVMAVKEAFSLPEMPSDQSLIKQQKSLMAMAAATEVMSERIKIEVATVKDLLETGTEHESTIKFVDILSHMSVIKDALLKADMQKPLTVLDEQMTQLEEWQSSGASPSRDKLIAMADAILYIESAINTIGTSDNEEYEESSGTFEEHKDKVIANSQLFDAQRILLVEAQTGIVEAIRQTMEYVESDYDKNALTDVTSHLRAASGGLMFTKLDRGARIVDSCIIFFEKEILASDTKLNQQKLDIIADALTALEYYLGGLMENKRYGEGMLDVAEEGLQALGYLKPA